MICSSRWFGLLLAALILSAAGNSTFAQPVPKQIKEQRLEQYLKYLTLSDEQLAEIKRLHAQYLDDWSKSFSRDIAILNADWSTAQTSPQQFEGESMVKAFQKAVEDSDRLRFKLKAANDFFFDSVQNILTEDQYPGLQRARLAHDRLIYGRGKYGVRERHLDLVEMVEQMPLQDDEKLKVQAFLLDFEPVFVEALQHAAEADQRHAFFEMEGMEASRGRDNLDEAARLAMAAKFEELGDQYGKICIGAQKRLTATNRSGLRQLLAILSPQSAAEFQRRYNEAAYPEIYPDAASADFLYEAALKLDDLDEIEKGALITLRQQYLDEHAALSKKMADGLYDLSVIYYRMEKDVYFDQSVAKQDDVVRIGVRREALNLSQPGKIRSLLTPEQSARLPQWRYEREAPPRPWDPNAPKPQLPPQRPPHPPATQPAAHASQ